MEKINVFFKINGKFYCENIPYNLTIDNLYDIIESKISSKIRKTHVIKIHGQIARENTNLSDYNITPECTLDVFYSISKAGLYEKPDIEGITMFEKLILNLAHDSGLYDINIISLMSYNVDLSNVKKNFLQQLQWPILKKELSKLDKMYKELDGLVNVNILLPDRNFIEYNSMYSPNFEKNKKNFDSIDCSGTISDEDVDSLISIINENSNDNPNSQINSLCDIKLNSAFNKNAHEYNYRISKHSIMLQNFKLKKIFGVSHSLEKITQMNFYYVGIIFPNTNLTNLQDLITYGVNFAPLAKYNLHVHMWTGDKIM